MSYAQRKNAVKVNAVKTVPETYIDPVTGYKIPVCKPIPAPKQYTARA